MTENRKWNVLLIEAGNVETPVQDIPVMAAYMQSTAYNWGFWSEPQEGSCLGFFIMTRCVMRNFIKNYDAGMNQQRCGFPRGKAVGGTSVINYMIYNRGHR